MEKIICIEEQVLRTLLARIEAISLAAENMQRKISPSNEDWIDSENVCRILTITNRTLHSYRQRGMLPYSTIGGKFFYRMNDVADFLEARTQKNQ